MSINRKVWCEICHQYVEEIAFGVLECGHHEDDIDVQEDFYPDEDYNSNELNFED